MDNENKLGKKLKFYGIIVSLNMRVFQTLILLVIFLEIATSSAFALSFKDMVFGVVENFGVASAQRENAQEFPLENLQNLKVFEAEKNLKAVSFQKEFSKSTLNNDNDSLEPGKENFYAGESLENNGESSFHVDNAVYKVRKGESIYSVASYFGISAETILSFNKINEKDVKEGLVLEVPPTSGINYEIKKGDTLAKLAAKYKLDVNDLSLFTGYSEDELLEVGEEIFLPGAKAEKIDKAKPKVVNKNIAKNKTATVASLGDLAKYIRNLGKGSTAQLNKISDIKKYFNLPKLAGYYIHPSPGTVRTQTMHGHNGADFAGKTGTPILAAADGVVKVAKNSGYNFGFGNYVSIAHPNGTETIYGHMSVVSVVAGQQVVRGQNIGAIGSSGNSTGPHLHFEIRGAYNPWAW